MTTTKEGLRRAVAAAIDQPEPGPGAIGTRRSIVIERISPELDGGRYPVTRLVGVRLLVTADIFADCH
jgi:starch synthase (maltosyl-transferring)